MGAKFATEPPTTAPTAERVSEPASGNTPLWRFALHTYGLPGVADEMLRLQDEHGADVLWLLTALWLADEGIALSQQLIVQPEYDQWRESMILPIRNQRRACDRTDTPDLYELLKKAELEAEREGLNRLYTAVRELEQSVDVNVVDNLACVLGDRLACNTLMKKITNKAQS